MFDPHAAASAGAELSDLAFGRFLLRRRQRLLLLDGAPAEVGSRALDVLLVLVEAAGDLVTKDAILDRVWPDVTVEENNLQVQVSTLRRVLGPDRDWIVTVPGRGYRFTGPVEAVRDGEAGPAGHLPEQVAQSRLSVIVLPFAGRGGDPAQDWFADALTDSLTTDLARAVPGSRVVAQGSADSYKAGLADVRDIGREQGVRYLVEGSVLLADDRVRVNAQLIEAGTGAHLWAERFDTSRHTVLQLLDEIVGRLSRAVGLEMIGAEARRAERVEQERPDAATAEDFVLRGRAGAAQPMIGPNGAEAARAHYIRALERDPGNPDALAGAASQRVYQVLNGYFDPGRSARDEAAAREALLAEADRMLGRALAAAPDHLTTLKARALLLRARGAFADALAAVEAILVRNPGDPTVLRETGLNLLYLGRAEEAVGWFRRADGLAPGDPSRWSWLQGLGRALIHLGRNPEAVDVLRLATASNPGYARSHALLAAALALADDDASARTALAEFRRAEPAAAEGALVLRSAVPFAATDPLYQAGERRVECGLRRAAGLV